MPDAAPTKEAHVPKELAVALLNGQIDIAQMVGLKQDTLYAIARVGHGFMKTGALDKALSVYQGLVAASPRDSVFHCHLAAVQVGLEKYDEALHHYGESLKYNAANVDALAGRGELLLRMKRVPEAVADLAKAVKADTTRKRPSAKRAAAMLMMLDQRMKAAKTAGKPAPAKKKR